MSARAIIRHFWLALLSGVPAWLLSGAVAWAADDPRDWIEQMEQAVQSCSFEGTMVYMQGGETSVVNVVQRVERGRVTQRITSADAGREIVRDNGRLTCISREQCATPVGDDGATRAQDGPLVTRIGSVAGIDRDNYNIAFSGAERIAGRDTRILAIRPQDGYRYGYRLWLDRATAMPLKTQLVAEDGRVLEQTLFTQIALLESTPDATARRSRPPARLQARQAGLARSEQRDLPSGEWEAARVPPGFRLTVPDAKQAAESSSWLHHLVYSDGLATLSLFIEPAVAASEQAEGLSQMGGANAFTTMVDGFMVTAVGKAPAETVEMLARSARPLVAANRQ